MNGQQLAARDPALAALLGAIPGHDFGYSEPAMNARSLAAVGAFGGLMNQGQFAVGFGDEYDDLNDLDVGFGDPNDYFAAGFGAAVKAAARKPAAHPSNVAALRARAQHSALTQHRASTEARSLLLDPNRNSTVKVERYSFSFSPTAPLVLGTASAIATFTQNPSTSIKGQRLIVNVPIPGFVYLTTLQIANVNVFVGGTEDAFSYSAQAQNSVLDLPRLDPQNRATAAGSYTGALPAGYSAGTNYTLVITLQGPATLAGGYGQ